MIESESSTILKGIGRSITGCVFVCLVLIIVVMTLATSPIWLSYRRWKYRGSPKSCCRSGCSACPWGNPKHKRHQAKILADIAKEAADGRQQRMHCYKKNCFETDGLPCEEGWEC